MKNFYAATRLLTVLSLLCGMAACNNDENMPLSPLTFSLSCANPTRSSVEVSVCPSDKETGYIYSIADRETYDALGSDAALVASDLENIDILAADAGMTREEFLTDRLMYGDVVSQTIDRGLQAGTDYYLYAYGMTPSGERVSELFRQPFRTESVAISSCTFEITVSPARTTVRIDVVPSDKQQYYYYRLLSGADYAALGGTPRDVALSIVRQQIEAWLGLGAASVAEAVKNFTLQGDHGYTATDLTSGSDYHLFVCGIDLQGDICTEITYRKVSTESFAMSDNRITLTVDPASVTWDSAEIAVSATNDDPYLVVVRASSELGSKTDEQVMRSIIAYYGESVETRTRRGDSTLLCDRTLMPATDYEALAFGYDGGITTTLARSPFTTKKTSTVASVAFEFRLAGSDNDLIHIEPSDQSVLYLWGSISEEVYGTYYDGNPTRLTEHVQALMEAYIPDVYPDAAAYVEGEGLRGTLEEDHWLFEGDGDYRFYAVCMNSDGTFADDPQVSDIFSF